MRLRRFLLAASASALLARPALAFEVTPDPQIAGLKVIFDDFPNDYVVNGGEVQDDRWYFTNGSSRTPGCSLETSVYDEFGSPGTTRGFLRAEVRLKRYSWYGERFHYNNSALLSLFVTYTDATGHEIRTPYAVPIHYLQGQQQFGDYIRAWNEEWTIPMSDVPFQGIIKNIKVQVCSIASWSIIDLEQVIVRMSDG